MIITRCPGCQKAMQSLSLSTHYGQNIEVDACTACKHLWFDGYEGSSMSADAVMTLFQLIHKSGGTVQAKTLPNKMDCARCQRKMDKSHDRTAMSSFFYQSCPAAHGRFISFYQFLIEKHFVRELSNAERQTLSVHVAQIRCSGCGAPVDLRKESACAYCQAPIAVFDKEAAEKAVDRYLKQRQRPSVVPSDKTKDDIIYYDPDPIAAQIELLNTGAAITYEVVKAMMRSQFTPLKGCAVADVVPIPNFDVSGVSMDAIAQVIERKSELLSSSKVDFEPVNIELPSDAIFASDGIVDVVSGGLGDFLGGFFD